MFEISIAASVMIIIGVVIRSIFINYIPKKCFVLIWGLVVARLLIPFSVSTPVSVWDMVEQPQLWVEERNPIIPQVQTNTMESTASQFDGDVEKLVGTELELEIMIKVIWMTGMVLGGSYFLYSHYKFRKEVADSLPVNNQFVEDWKLYEAKFIQVRESHKVSAPLTYGLIKPIILMPKATNWQDKKQLEYIFTHECVHIKRLDYVKKIILAITLCVHWFNPLVWVMYTLANRDLELSCDEEVLKQLGQNEKAAYALTLINMEANRGQFAPLYNGFNKHGIEERIKVMVNMRKKSILGAVFAITLVGGAMTVFATSQEAGEESLNLENEAAIISELDYEGFAKWIERRLIEEESESDPWLEGQLETLKDGGTIRIYEMPNGSTTFVPSGTEMEQLDAKTFSEWMEQRLIDDANSGEFLPREMDLLRRYYEGILANIKNGTAIVHLLEDGEISIIGDDGADELFDFSSETNIELDYQAFKIWMEESLVEREVSGDYTDAELTILRNRFENELNEFYGQEDIRFVIDENNELIGVSSSTTVSDSISIETEE